MSLYHFTCDHGYADIIRDGHVKPLFDILGGMEGDGPAAPPSGSFAWFTDLDTPNRDALGLTSRILSCDRTAYRFEVTDETQVARWLDMRRLLPALWPLELAPGAMPAHWWIASEPVPVVPS